MQPDNRFLDALTPTSTVVEEAVVLDHPEALQWDLSCDALIVGAGMAGVCAALRTAEDRNLQVICIDRGEGGGASKLSGGVVYMGGGTKAQREAGIEDSPENMADYLRFEAGDVVRPDTIRRFAAASTHFQDWLEQYGARFGGPSTDDKTSYPDNASLYFSGNELTVAGRARAVPAPRGHRAKPTTGGEPTALSGSYLLPPLIASMEQQPNVSFLRQTRATRMFVDHDGTVVGVEVKRITSPVARWGHAKLMKLVNNMIVSALGFGTKVQSLIATLEARAQPLRIRARRGVVLSSGGFMFNREMLARTAPAYLGAYPLGTLADDGSGIKLGMTVGARTDLLNRVSAWKFLYAPENWVKGCSISRDGQRLVCEEYYGARTGEAVFEHANGAAWLIMDQPLMDLVDTEVASTKHMFFQKIILKAIRRDYTQSAETLEALAAKIGISTDGLLGTIATYNQAIDEGKPDALGKSDKYRCKLNTGPFYAMSIGEGLKLAPIPALTMGGLVVDEITGEVLATSGGTVRGLLAAGRTAVGICSRYYVSGLSLGDCVWSGLRAAETIRGNGGADALAPEGAMTRTHRPAHHSPD